MLNAHLPIGLPIAIFIGNQRCRVGEICAPKTRIHPACVGHGCIARRCSNCERLIQCECDGCFRLPGDSTHHGGRIHSSEGHGIVRLGRLHLSHGVQCQPGDRTGDGHNREIRNRDRGQGERFCLECAGGWFVAEACAERELDPLDRRKRYEWSRPRILRSTYGLRREFKSAIAGIRPESQSDCRHRDLLTGSALRCSSKDELKNAAIFPHGYLSQSISTRCRRVSAHAFLNLACSEPSAKVIGNGTKDVP